MGIHTPNALHCLNTSHYPIFIMNKEKLEANPNVVIASCSCEDEGCSNKILLIKESILRRNNFGEEEVCEGRTAIADLSYWDVLDLFLFCKYHLAKDNPDDFKWVKELEYDL